VESVGIRKDNLPYGGPGNRFDDQSECVPLSFVLLQNVLGFARRKPAEQLMRATGVVDAAQLIECCLQFGLLTQIEHPQHLFEGQPNVLDAAVHPSVLQHREGQLFAQCFDYENGTAAAIENAQHRLRYVRDDAVLVEIDAPK
jgi:hypothetical protein